MSMTASSNEANCAQSSSPWRAKGSVQTGQPGDADMNQAMIDEFVAAIREEREPRITGVDGHRAVEIVAAAYESAQTGQPVRLDRASFI